MSNGYVCKTNKTDKSNGYMYVTTDGYYRITKGEDFGLVQLKPHLRKGSQALSFVPGQENTNGNIYPLIYLFDTQN